MEKNAIMVGINMHVYSLKLVILETFPELLKVTEPVTC